jgi:hypothetical protein
MSNPIAGNDNLCVQCRGVHAAQEVGKQVGNWVGSGVCSFGLRPGNRRSKAGQQAFLSVLSARAEVPPGQAMASGPAPCHEARRPESPQPRRERPHGGACTA